MSATAEKLPTSIEVLDRKLDGGIPPGRIAVLSAPSVSQSELFLYEVASARESVYISTERAEPAVRAVLQQTGTDRENIDVVAVEDPLEDADRATGDLSERSTVVVDPMLVLERHDPDRYRGFLNDLKGRLMDTDSIAVLHCLDRRTLPATRDTTEYIADIVFELSTDVRGETVENHLTVPKYRGGQPLNERIKLNLSADVTIDISRTIA